MLLRNLAWILFFVCCCSAQQVDVVFVVDGSGSISSSDWQLQKGGLVAAILNTDYVPLDGSVAVSVVQFSSSARVEIPYRIIQTTNDVQTLVNLISGMTQIGGSTGPGEGIYAAITELNASARGSANQMFCVTTDGAPNTGRSTAGAISDAKASNFGLDSFGVIAIGTAPGLQSAYGGLTFGGGSLFVVQNTAEFANTVGANCFPTEDVKLVGLEVIQVVQDLKNSVAVIEKKQTLVRAYLEPVSTSTTSVTVTGRLIGRRDGTDLPLSPLSSQNVGTSIVAKQNALDRRHVMADSLNFVLDEKSPWVSAGTTELEIELVGASLDCQEAAGPVGNDCKTTVTFVQGSEIEVKLLKVNTPSARTSDTDLDVVEAQLLAMFPTSHIDAKRGTKTATLQPDGTLDLYSLLSETASTRFWDCLFSLGLDCDRLFFAAADQQQQLFADSNGFTTLGIAYRPGTAGTGRLKNGSQRGIYTPAHELAHNMNVPHANSAKNTFCLEVTNGDTFPFYSTIQGVLNVPTIGPMNLGDNKKMYGWNSRQNTILSPEEHFELMSYCGPKHTWISSHTYEAVRQFINGEYSTARRSLAVSTAVDICITTFSLVNGVASLSPLFRVTGLSSIPGALNNPTGQYQISFKDAAEVSLVHVMFEPTELEAGLTDTEEVFFNTFAVECSSDVVSVTVSDDLGTELSTLTASLSEPTVQVLFPNGGESLSGETVEITWTASDADGDELTFTVLISLDGGSTWTTLGSRVSATSLTVPLVDLGATAEGLIRVLASDGFLSGEDTSDATFITPNNEPTVSVEKPSTDDVFVGVQVVVMNSFARDTEDGTLDGNSIKWTSSLNGALGSGASLSILASDLIEGTHDIMVEVTDSVGATATDSVMISIFRVILPPASRTCQPRSRLLISTNGSTDAPKITKSHLGMGHTRSLQGDNDMCGGACDYREDCALDLMSDTYSCVCKEGYVFVESARQCQDENECDADVTPCPGLVDGIESSYCVDYEPPERYKCGCNVGFTAVLPSTTNDPVPLEWRPMACINVDQCTTDSPCHANATCSDGVGGFMCTCNEGYIGDGFACGLTPSSAPSSVDEKPDECANKCTTEEHQICAPSKVVSGSFACLCEDGFLQLFEGGGCRDLDECDPDRPLHDCDLNAKCINIPGEFLCECNEGYFGGGRDCTKKTSAPTTAPPTMAPVTPAPTNATEAVVAAPGPPGPSCFANGVECSSNGDCCSDRCA